MIERLRHWLISLLAMSGRGTEGSPGLGESLLGAASVVLIGLLAGWVLAWMVRRTLARLLVDRFFEESVARVGPLPGSMRPSLLLGRLTFWLVVIVALSMALEILGVKAISIALAKLLAYLPNLLAALAILFVGTIGAQAFRTAAIVGMDRAGLDVDPRIPSVLYYVVLGIVLIMAAGQLQIDVSALANLLYIAVGACAVFFGLVLAWGCRHAVENIIAGFYLRQVVRPGETIRTASVEGTVDAVENTHVRMSDRASQSIFVPNSLLFSEVCRVQPVQETEAPAEKK